MRIALGATRWRVVRQLLVESVLLGALGGVLGLALAAIGVRLFDAAVADIGKPYWIKFTMDYTVFAFLAAICVLTGVLFGLAPALQVTRTNVNEVLKEGGRGNAGSRRARGLTTTMVVVELALTLVLLVGAGLMVRSFLNLYTLDLGMDTKNLVMMRMVLPDAEVRDAGAAAGLLRAANAAHHRDAGRRERGADNERAAVRRLVPWHRRRRTGAAQTGRTCPRGCCGYDHAQTSSPRPACSYGAAAPSRQATACPAARPRSSTRASRRNCFPARTRSAGACG